MAEKKNAPIIRASNLVNHLRSALRDGWNAESNRLSEPSGDGKWRPLPDQIPFEGRPSLSHFGQIVERLEHILTDAGYDAQSSNLPLSVGEFWSLGCTTLNFPIRSIHGGFVEPVLRVPVIPRVPEIVVSFLLAIPSERDLLEREHHDHVGWHYHYLDYRKGRSNVVLCWDTRAELDKDETRPLFQETHGEGHTDFTARPDLWGPEKKNSMHVTCAPDLDAWPLKEFRCASMKAGPVWPLSSKLTPITKAVAPVPRFPSKKKGRR